MEQLREGLLSIVKRIRGAAYVDEQELEAVIRDLQRTLLRADVDPKLVLEVSQRIREKFKSAEQPPGFSKRELLLKLLYDELVSLLGGQSAGTLKPSRQPYTILLVGVEGSGKTTTAAKLAYYFQNRGFKVGLISADTYRPGALEQLKQLSEKVGCLFYGEPGEKDAVAVAGRGVRVLSEQGAQVLLVSGPTALPTPFGVQRIDVETAQQMFDAVMARVAQAQVFIATAAVADWRPAQVAAQKQKKSPDAPQPAIALQTNPDILASVAALPQPPYCVGFAAESENLIAHAAAKRARKNVPLLVGNLGPDTFGLDDNRLELFDASGHHPLGAGRKIDLARRLVAEVARRLEASDSPAQTPPGR